MDEVPSSTEKSQTVDTAPGDATGQSLRTETTRSPENDVISSESISSSGKYETHTFNDWTISFRQSHILPSKCSGECTTDCPCVFCLYSKELDSGHLPEMVFPFNLLELRHKNGSAVEFNALDALKCVKKTNESVQIACSESWKKAREDTGLADKIAGDYDWTFRTDYSGTYSDWESRSDTDLSIDMDKLRQREKILLYRELTLFDDELHDNGISLCNVRIRVMPSCFFILLRHFLRVDGVIIMALDSRVYHDFSTDYVLLETSHRESKVSELRIPFNIMNESDEVTPLLTMKSSKCEKLKLKSSS